MTHLEEYLECVLDPPHPSEIVEDRLLKKEKESRSQSLELAGQAKSPRGVDSGASMWQRAKWFTSPKPFLLAAFCTVTGSVAVFES